MQSNSSIILEQIVIDQKNELEIDAPISNFFGNFSAIQILKNYELSYEEIEKGDVDGGLDGGIDNIYIFINGEYIDWNLFELDADPSNTNDENQSLNIEYLKEKYKTNITIEVYLLQSKFENSFNEDVFNKLKSSLNNLLNFEIDIEDLQKRYNSSILNAFSVIKEIYLKLISRRCTVDFKVFYSSRGHDVHPNVQCQANELNDLIQGKLTNTKASVEFIGAQRLIDLYQKRPDTNFELNFVENAISNNKNSYISIVNIKEFFKFITDDNKTLIKYIFESNVRDYQGNNNVNSEIFNSLKNKKSEDFWWLNNGITILCSTATLVTGRQLNIQNPEIVNGLQTSFEIYRYFHENPNFLNEEDTRNVLVRVIIPTSEEVRDKIIKATNSQTQIPNASLRATDPIHRQIEEFLKSKGYFYDRRKNFYKNEGKKPKEIISIPFMSQCLISVLLQKPDSARARPSSLLKDDIYNELYSPNTPLDVFYLLSFFGKKVEESCRSIEGLEANQSSDIKFHVLYAAIALAVEDIKPNIKQIIALNEKNIADVLPDAIEITKNLYLQNGGNNKTAKSLIFKDNLIENIKNYLDTYS